MSIVCQIDQTEHESIDALHAYVKTAYHLSQKSYWTSYAPRKDLHTGEPIVFKDVEQYLSTDFSNKNNLKAWLKAQSRETGLAWAKEWLRKRKESKGLVYAPSQAELRTLCTPTMPFFNSVAADEGGYYGVTRAMGFKDRYKKPARILVEYYSDPTIIQDTREQAAIKLNLPTQIETLDVGDYALATPWDEGIRIERKSLSDFCGTLSGRKQIREGKTKDTEWNNLERFDRELARAVEKGLYVVMMVESPLNHVYAIRNLPQTKWVKASSEYLLHNLRDLLVKYPLSFQVVFVDGRREMADKMVKILQLGKTVKEIDLQFALEEGLL